MPIRRPRVKSIPEPGRSVAPATTPVADPAKSQERPANQGAPVVGVFAAVLSSVLLTGCLQSTSIVKVNPDGSGTVETQTLVTTAALAQMRQLAGAFGGANGRPVDPFSEEQMQQLATQMGDGVSLLSTKPLKTADAEGREAVYAFRDITKLRLSETPAAPGGASVRAGGIGVGNAQGQQMTIDLTKTPAGTMLLTLHTGGDPLRGIVDQLGGSGRGVPLAADQIAMMRPMLGGMRIALRLQPGGRVVKSNSPYVDGNTVTLFDIDMDALLNDPGFERLMTAKTGAEAQNAIKDIKGVKFAADRDITVEFEPR